MLKLAESQPKGIKVGFRKRIPGRRAINSIQHTRSGALPQSEKSDWFDFSDQLFLAQPLGDDVKSRQTYLLLCIFGGLVGLHHFYLLKFGKAFLYMFTMGLFMIGWIRDMIFANQDVDCYNASRGFVNTNARNSVGV